MKKAFTLAEILITLSIIGVVASITIPSLIYDIQTVRYTSLYKKTYADFAQIIKRAATENGGSLKGLCDSNHGCFRNLFLPYLNYTKNCNVAEVTSCISGHFKGSGWENGAAVVLTNGVAVNFYSYSANCTFTQSYLQGGACGEIGIDVNGLKPPNVPFKDQFIIEVLKNNIRPRETPNSTPLYN